MGIEEKQAKRKWRYLLEYFVFRSVVCLIDALPTRVTVRLAEMLAFAVFRFLPRKMIRYEVARQNLKTAFGDRCSDKELDEIQQQMWVHLFRLITEIVQLPRKIRLYNCADVVQFRNRDESVKAMSCGRPVIVLSGHFGNWEMAVSAFGMFGFPMGVVARDLDNPYLHRWFMRFREHTGHRLLSKKGGGGDMVEYLERRGNLALLGDQDAGKRGLFVPFFGQPASTFKSIALLALQYRAVIVVGYAIRLPDDFSNSRWVRFEQGCEAVLDPDDYQGPDAVRELTADYTSALERAILRAPEQYFWVHRRWKSQPAERKTKAAKAA
jgi:Kdo2-lipid IVA lauroyltransferase/acyltransferase